VGLNTFIDPAQSGGRMNARTTEPLVERLELDGQTWLRYKSVPIHVGLIRATYADRRGNLSMDKEGLIGEVLPIAQAAKNHGGIVIAQVESIVDQLPDPKSVRVPGILVDYLVVSGGVQHDQTFGEVFNEDFVVTSDGGFTLPTMPESERKIIGTRALREICEGDIVNLGIGLPESVAMVAAETGRLSEFTLTVESGPIGGVPASGLNFGCSHFPEAIIDQPSQFDFYDGGGLDIAVLGAVEVDAQGSVNVTSFADRFAGVGGFVNIAQSARRLVFCCTFQAKGQPKFVRQIQHVCFHGPTAFAHGQQVLYVTERAVFGLTADGLRLIEISDGYDLQTDILDKMEFKPAVAL
jgi:propionate CoA-transferase